MAIADMNPGMSPWFTVTSLVVTLLLTTSPCSGYFLTRLQPTPAASNSMIPMTLTTPSGFSACINSFSPIKMESSCRCWHSFFAPQPWLSVVEPEAQFDKDFARIIPVEAPEGSAVVEFDPPIGDLQRVQRGGDALAEVLPQRQIAGRIPGQIAAGIRLVR